MWAVVPLKGFGEAKSRLGAALDPGQRAGLMRAMAEDVLRALNAAARIERIAVVTSDPDAAALARAAGAVVIADRLNDGHTAAVRQAVVTLAERDVGAMMQLPGDVPLATAAEIDQVAARHGPAPSMTITPARDGRGSNCVVLSPPDAITLAFGNDSFVPHLAAAKAAGLNLNVVRMAGIALDVDQPDDLLALRAAAPGGATGRFLATIGRRDKPGSVR